MPATTSRRFSLVRVQIWSVIFLRPVAAATQPWACRNTTGESNYSSCFALQRSQIATRGRRHVGSIQRLCRPLMGTRMGRAYESVAALCLAPVYAMHWALDGATRRTCTRVPLCATCTLVSVCGCMLFAQLWHLRRLYFCPELLHEQDTWCSVRGG